MSARPRRRVLLPALAASALGLLLAGCSDAADVQAGPADPLPAPRAGIVARVADDCRALVKLLEGVTSVPVTISAESSQLLAATPVPLVHDCEVAARDVYFVVETVLAETDFVVLVQGEGAARSLEIVPRPKKAAGLPSDRSMPLDRAGLSVWLRHPAVLVRTTVPVAKLVPEQFCKSSSALAEREGGALRAVDEHTIEIVALAPRALAIAETIAAIDARL